MRTAFTVTAVLATHGVSTDERLHRLEALDLTNVRRKLMEPYPEGKGWTEAQARQAEMWYKRYIATIIKYPDATQHVPNGPIDFFWHQHILDTMAYGPDCMNVLGYFLHHYPYFGLNGDAVARDTSFDDTNELYRAMFGEDCRQMTEFQVKSGHAKVEGKDCKAGCCNNGAAPIGVSCSGDTGESCKSGCSNGDDVGRQPIASIGAACHGESCSQGCSNCGRDNRAPATPKSIGCEAVSCDGTPCTEGANGGHGSKPLVGIRELAVIAGVNCGHGGSGTGCGQGCRRGQND